MIEVTIQAKVHENLYSLYEDVIQDLYNCEAFEEVEVEEKECENN